MAVSDYTATAQAVQTAIQGIGLTGIPSGQVYNFKLPTDRPADGVVLPSVQVTYAPVGERFRGLLNTANDIEYPLMLTFLAAGNQNFSWDQTWLQWRRQVETAFHNKRPLSSLSINPYCRIEPRAVVDANLARDANLNVGQLLLWAWVREDRPAPPSGSATPSGNLIYTGIGEGVQAAVQSLGLAGIANAQVLLQKVWSDRAAVGVNLASGAAVIVSTGAQPEREVGPMNSRDDWYWPVWLTILRASDQSLTWDDTWPTWRQTIRRAFHNQRLSAASTVWRIEVEPQMVLDAGEWHDKNIDLGQLLLRCRSREQRS